MGSVSARILGRALVVWLILIAAEILHGIARGILLVPHLGAFRSSQIGVFTGSLIILLVTLVFVHWIGAVRSSQLLGVGLLWLCLTLAFEVLFGRFVLGASWERRAADYNVPQGGLLPFGMAFLMFAPLIAVKMRESIRQARAGGNDFKSPEELHAFIDKVAEKLQSKGQAEAAETLASIQNVAFTTGSEWLGKLGLLVRGVQRTFDLDADTGRDLKRTLRSVNRVWPRL